MTYQLSLTYIKSLCRHRCLLLYLDIELGNFYIRKVKHIDETVSITLFFFITTDFYATLYTNLYYWPKIINILINYQLGL